MMIVLKKPQITEKTMKLASQGMYTFIVDKDARKPAIIQAVESQFNVNVTAVKTATFKDEKKTRRGKRGYFMTGGYKKAIVGLKDGQKIALFETETAKSEEKEEVEEKKSLLKGTKVKIERGGKKEDKESK